MKLNKNININIVYKNGKIIIKAQIIKYKIINIQRENKTNTYIYK